MKQYENPPRGGSMNSSWLLVVLIILAGCSTPDLIATTSSKEYISGVPTQVYTFNGTVPGPVLRAEVGKPFKLEVRNDLPEPMTIHWHGVRVPNAMDGVPGVTQKPISPGNSFLYEFIPQDPGIFWYHSHVDTHKQVEMGLQGAFVVEDQALHIPSDDSHVLVLDDIAIKADGSYQSFDLNYMHGRFGSILLVNGEQQPTIHSSGVMHRFQLVNTANARSFVLSFDRNPITVYGQDIGYMEPYETTVLQMHPGERFDVVVKADEDFRILDISRVQTLLATVSVQPISFDVEQTTYTAPKVPMPQELYQQVPDLELSLEGVRHPKYGLVWQINGTDSLSNPGVFTLQKGITKIRLKNLQGQPHPMHLHGQQFMILSRNGVQQEHQGWKDTVMVGSYENVDIAVLLDEPGDWVFHCHILEHAKAGMLTTIQVKESAT